MSTEITPAVIGQRLNAIRKTEGISQADNPATVLAMIERIRRLEEERQAAVDALHQWVWGVEYDDKNEVENAFEQAKEIVKKGVRNDRD